VDKAESPTNPPGRFDKDRYSNRQYFSLVLDAQPGIPKAVFGILNASEIIGYWKNPKICR